MNKQFQKVIDGLEKCLVGCDYECPYWTSPSGSVSVCMSELDKDAITLLKALFAFKSYFDSLYGQGLEVVNWHMNGAIELFDSFYDSAMEEYENAQCE